MKVREVLQRVGDLGIVIEVPGFLVYSIPWYIPYPGRNPAKFIPILGSLVPGPGSLAPL